MADCEIDAKVNMSLADIIKMGKNKKKNKQPATAVTQKSGKGGAKRNRGGVARGRGGQKNMGRNGISGKSQAWRLNRNPNQNLANRGGGFVQKRYNKNGGLTRSRSNLNLAANRALPKNIRGAGASRRGRGGRALNRSRSRTNLTYTKQGGFYTANNNNNNNNNNKNILKRTNSLPNLIDPTSVHNRLGYQSPAQVAYRNRVKRAKQVLLQRQHQRVNDFRLPQAIGKSLTTLQRRALERRQQILTSQRRFNTGGLRSDQIVRAQRRALYEQKVTRMNTARMMTAPNVNFMCTLGNEYVRGIRQRSTSLSRNRGGSMNNLRQLPRGRSPFPQNIQLQGVNMAGRGQQQLFPQQQRPAARSRSRSRSRNRNIPIVDTAADVDDRTFSEVMYSLSGNLGVTGRTLNDRFSFQ